jgi:hypothetical protein
LAFGLAFFAAGSAGKGDWTGFSDDATRADDLDRLVSSS